MSTQTMRAKTMTTERLVSLLRGIQAYRAPEEGLPPGALPFGTLDYYALEDAIAFVSDVQPSTPDNATGAIRCVSVTSVSQRSCFIAPFEEISLDDLLCDPGEAFEIEAVLMTQAELDALPEFRGF